MKKIFQTFKRTIASGIIFASCITANGQAYVFPQNIDYSFGYKPVGPDDAQATAAYAAFKTYLTPGPACAGTGTIRVKFDSNSKRFGIAGDNSRVTVSEGIGYGMLLAAYAGDQANFDGLWAYYKKFKNPSGIMNWGIDNQNNCNFVGVNGATDAELDVTWALYVAHNQWGGTTYLNDAKTMVAAIKATEIDKAGNLNTLKPGDKFGGHQAGNDLVNPSYFSPAYYRVFGEITNDNAFWMSVYDRGYDILEKAANPSTGLVPDWSTSGGTTPAPNASTYDDGGVNFFYDAVRAPVRTALDYLWYGDQAPRALSFTTKINNWLRLKHPNVADIGAKYSLSGAKLDVSHNNTFVGAFAVSAMATADPGTRNYITSLYKEDVKLSPGAGEYFNTSWKALSLFMLTGNFYLPPPDACDGAYLEPDYHLCQGTGNPKSLTLNADPGNVLPGAIFQWKRDGAVIAGATTKTFATSTPGNYEVTSTITVAGKPCVRRAATIVYQAAPVANFSFVRSGQAVDFTNNSKGGDLFSDVPSLTSAWSYGTGATPLTSTTANGATNYSTTGVKVVTLTVTNKCGNTSTYTEQIPLLQATGPGWSATNFESTADALFGAFTGPGVVNPNVTFTSNCQYGTAAVAKAMGRYETVAVTFKSSGSDAPLDVTGYPFVRFRIKIDATDPALFPNGLRVDLVDTKFKATGDIPANIVYLKGPRNPDGTYQPLPLNQWFISTISYEGKLGAIDALNTLQLAFYPYNDFPTAAGRSDYKINVDWVTVGNKDIVKPSPTLSSGTTYFCDDQPYKSITGFDLDSCNAESVKWSDGYAKFARNVGVGTYTVTVSNFAGDEVRTITVDKSPKLVADLSYSIVSTTPFQIQPYDNSTGAISNWRWHRTTSPTQTLSTAPSATAGNTFVYAANSSNVQAPAPTPTAGRPTTALFTGNTTEYLCLTITSSVVSNCSATPKKCILVTNSLTAIEDYITNTSFKVYPTLVENNKVFIESGSSLNGTYEVNISSLSGLYVANKKIHSGINLIELDNNAPSGVYVVNINQDGKIVTKKFVKQ